MNDEANENAEPPHAPAPKFLAVWIVLGLVAWGGYLAYGAASSAHNVWRGVVVVACFVLFIAWFGGLQWLYARRHRRK